LFRVLVILSCRASFFWGVWVFPGVFPGEGEDDEEEAEEVAGFWLVFGDGEDPEGFGDESVSDDGAPSMVIDLSRPWRELNSWANSGFCKRVSISVKLGSICFINSSKPLRNSGLLSSAMISASRAAASGELVTEEDPEGFDGVAAALALAGVVLAGGSVKSSRAPALKRRGKD